MRCRRCSQELPSRADRCLRCFALNPQNVCGPLFAGLDSDPPREVRVRFDDEAPPDLAVSEPARPSARQRKARPAPKAESASLPFAGTRMGTPAAPREATPSDPPQLPAAAILKSDPPQLPAAAILKSDPPRLPAAAIPPTDRLRPNVTSPAPDPLPPAQTAACRAPESLFPALLRAWALDLAFVGALVLLHVGLAVAVLGPDRLAPGRTGSLDYWVDLLRGGGLFRLWVLLAATLGIAYAAFFTAIPGRTPGLALSGLRRVSTGGRRIFGSFAREP